MNARVSAGAVHALREPFGQRPGDFRGYTSSEADRAAAGVTSLAGIAKELGKQGVGPDCRSRTGSREVRSPTTGNTMSRTVPSGSATAAPAISNGRSVSPVARFSSSVDDLPLRPALGAGVDGVHGLDEGLDQVVGERAAARVGVGGEPSQARGL